MTAVARCRVLGFIPARFWLLVLQEPENGLLHVCGSLRDLLSAEELDTDKGDGEIKRGEDEVDAERVPPIGFDEVFEPLRDCRIWGRWGDETGW